MKRSFIFGIVTVALLLNLAVGAKIYLNGNPDLSDALSRIEKAGGKVTMPKTQIGEFGFMAFFTDTEGNTVALHSNK